MLTNISNHQLANYLRLFSPSLKHFKDGFEANLFAGQGREIQPNYTLYICPICLTDHLYFDADGFYETAEFSMDHFPPKNVGGDLEALVCKKCNNDAGGQFDFITKDFLNDHAFRQGVPGISLRMKSLINGVPGYYSGQIGVRSDGEIELSFLPNKKSHAPLLEAWLNKGAKAGDWEARISIPKPDTDKVAKAFLKTAYLACFHQWGYEFLFSPTGQKLRTVLAGQAVYPLAHVPTFVFDQKEILDVVRPGVCFVQNPRELRSFAVNIPLTLAENGYRCIATILIPSPTGWDDFHLLNDHLTPQDRDITMTALHPSILRGVYNGYSTDWDTLTA